jgi:lycopene beta-cyclase
MIVTLHQPEQQITFITLSMNHHTTSSYDYIIAGCGCAGMSLLYRLLLEPALNGKKILVIDSTRKVKNDRTWCFWEKETGLFQPIVHHQWDQLDFFSDYHSGTMHIAPYRYKMIRGVDFYRYVHALAAKFNNVEFRYEHITKLSVSGQTSLIETLKGVYSAKYIFNSTKYFSRESSAKTPSLIMHFKGWSIKTSQACFDEKKGTFTNKRFLWYDRTFLYVLITGKMKGAELMSTIIEKIAPEKVLDFLSNKSKLVDEFNIMKSFPAKIFLPAALKQL